MPPRNYSLKDKKYEKYIQILSDDKFNILSNYCDYLQFLYKFKSLLQFKIEQIQKIEDNKSKMKKNEKLFEQIENEKFVLKVELDKLSRGKYKNYLKQINTIIEEKMSYEQKLDLCNQMIQFIQQILVDMKIESSGQFDAKQILIDSLEQTYFPESEPPKVIKPKRGRPAKKTEEEPKSKRGKPAKKTVEEVVEEIIEESSVEEKPKTRRGRPSTKK